jgi:hypothetical protein
MLLGTKENNANKLFDGAPTLIEISRQSAVGSRQTETSNA